MSLEQSGTLDARRMLEQLVEQGAAAVSAPVRLPDPPDPLVPVNRSKFAGMMLGLAIGDALGNTSEGMNPHERRARHGEIRHYLPNPYASDERIGLPSDDSQLAFWTLEQLVTDGEYLPDRLAKTLASGQIFGI